MHLGVGHAEGHHPEDGHQKQGLNIWKNEGNQGHCLCCASAEQKVCIANPVNIVCLNFLCFPKAKS